ncbi:MAG TPA: hypothetical protein VGL40_03220, partial [Bacillota bacterium]
MVMVVNVSKKSVLAGRVSRLATRWRGLAHLVTHPELYPGEGILVEGEMVRSARTVGTRFLRYPIDIVFVGETGRVIGSAPGVRPFTYVPVPAGTDRLVKLPLGTIDASATACG